MGDNNNNKSEAAVTATFKGAIEQLIAAHVQETNGISSFHLSSLFSFFGSPFLLKEL